MKCDKVALLAQSYLLAVSRPTRSSVAGPTIDSGLLAPVRGAFPHRSYTYAKPSSRLECSVLLITHLEIELQSELHVTRIDSTSHCSEIAGSNR
jgi:hypothetical protein